MTHRKLLILEDEYSQSLSIRHPKQRAENRAAVVAGQFDDAGFNDEATQLDEVPRALATLDLPRAHVISRLFGLMPVARRSVAAERRPCCGQLPVHFAAPGFERTKPRAWPKPPSFRPLLSRLARSARPPARLC